MGSAGGGCVAGGGGGGCVAGGACPVLDPPPSEQPAVTTMTRNANAYAVSVRDHEVVVFPQERIGLWPAIGSTSGKETRHSGSQSYREQCRLIGNLGGDHGDETHVRKKGVWRQDRLGSPRGSP